MNAPVTPYSSERALTAPSGAVNTPRLSCSLKRMPDRWPRRPISRRPVTCEGGERARRGGVGGVRGVCVYGGCKDV